jgi:hypothetical protein
MDFVFKKFGEIFSNMWVKVLTVIPLGFFVLEEREGLMVLALLVIMFIDCLFGAFKSRFVDNNFEWTLLGKKFSKKFLLYFFTLLASFIMHKAYPLLEFWFYSVGSLIVFSEMGDLLIKARALGLPIRLEMISYWNNFIDNWVHTTFNIPYKKKQKKAYTISKRDLEEISERIAINTARLATSKAKRMDLQVDVADLQAQIDLINKEK